MSEFAFQQRLLLALGRRKDMRVWRQNVGSVLVRDARGKVQRTFRAGPPNGAADITGIVRPEGWRHEVECKAPKGKTAAHQKAWERMVTDAGGVYVRVIGDDSPESVARAIADIDAAIADRRARG